MNEGNFEKAQGLVSKAYIEQAKQARKARENLLRDLLSQRKIPERGWDDQTIELILQELALMDSNNFSSNVGVGEREARVYSHLVSRRHYYLAHGIGRSGEIAAEQPKAAGSSLLMKLTNCMALSAVKLAGITNAGGCIVLPLATGMSITLVLLALRQSLASTSTATSSIASASSSVVPTGASSRQYVVWPRVDQKTCLKAIVSAGYTPLVIRNVVEGDQVRVDMAELAAVLEAKHGEIAAVISTTSCFAPRSPDPVVDIAALCSRFHVAHIVNNAYGLQASRTCAEISDAMRKGRVDAVIQSTDKNFLVPVGGAVVVVGDTPQAAKFLEEISATYPGRASAAPIVDLFVTLLSMGAEGLRKLLTERKELFTYMSQKLADVAKTHGERLLKTPANPISMGITLEQFGEQFTTMLGSMLFTRAVSGTRTVAGNASAKKTVAGIAFANYGAHIDAYPVPYLTAACAIGMTKQEVDEFVHRLDKTLVELKQKMTKAKAKHKQQEPEPKKKAGVACGTPEENDRTAAASELPPIGGTGDLAGRGRLESAMSVDAGVDDIEVEKVLGVWGISV